MFKKKAGTSGKYKRKYWRKKNIKGKERKCCDDV